ncbi:hypothetical protein [Amycolatopsis sp. WAC 01416]|nr:hypothetical protein [Amycolatopsis sp. WAC 01416]
MDQPLGEALRSYRIALMLTQEVLGEQALSSAQAVGALKHGAGGSRAARA